MSKNWDGISLYHYTSFKALEGIINTKELWMGNIHYMNDRKEVLHFFECLQKEIEKDLPDKKKEIEQLFKKQNEKYNGKTAYIFSLSNVKDDASQWDRYANGGRGVCIKINAAKLVEIIEKNSKIMTLQNIYYSSNMSSHQSKALIETYLETGNISESWGSIDALFENLWMCALAFKHDSFKAEDEVRICSWPFMEGCNDLRYIVSENGLREYFPLKLCSEIERSLGNIIEEICLGPNSGVDHNMFFRYLQTMNFDWKGIEITQSDCPLR